MVRQYHQAILYILFTSYTDLSDRVATIREIGFSRPFFRQQCRIIPDAIQKQQQSPQ
jgi:hypothetical protein